MATEIEKLQLAVNELMQKAQRDKATPATGIKQGGTITLGATAYRLSDFYPEEIKGVYSINRAGILTEE